MDAYWLDLDLMPYIPAFEIQEKILEARMEGHWPSTIILQENPKTFTIGRSGSRKNVLASADVLLQHGIEVIEVNRGGDVTYHGPGQVIASPLFYLGDLNLNANQYMHTLEDVLMLTLKNFGIKGTRQAEYPGVWVGSAKIASVGIGVRHGFTFHGMALNVNLDLLPFKWMNPCGVSAMPVTSMEMIIGQMIPMVQVHEALMDSLTQVFNLHLQVVSLYRFQSIMESFCSL